MLTRELPYLNIDGSEKTAVIEASARLRADRFRSSYEDELAMIRRDLADQRIQFAAEPDPSQWAVIMPRAGEYADSFDMRAA